MMTVAQALAIAAQHYQAGNLNQAEQLCAQVLREDPRHAGGLFLLGLIDRQAGRYDLAVEHLAQAVRWKPDFAEAHNSLGNALREQKRLEEAVASFRQALRLNPHLAEARSNLGVALMELGRLAEAVASLQQALNLKPNYAEAQNNLGLALSQQGRLEEAAASLRQALRLRPDYVEAHNNLGTVLTKQGKLAEAVASLQQALNLKPNHADAHINLGSALMEQGRLEEAVVSLRHALRLQPNRPEAHYNLGNALRDQLKIDEAVASFQEAIRLKPSYAEAHNNLGNALREQGKLNEAVTSFQQALCHNPHHAEAHRNLALTLLLLGNFDQGFSEYEWRWQCKEFVPKRFRQQSWGGAPLEGKKVLLYAEQGLGDTLQFIRYAPLVKQRGGVVLVESPAPLIPLLSRCPDIDQVVAKDSSVPDFDVHAALMSLPGIFGTTLATVPAAVPYLFADPALCEHWRQELRGSPAFKVGIVWQGSAKYKDDRRRSVPLASFAPLARLAGVQLISLQKGPGSEQLHQQAGGFSVTDLGSRLDEKSGAFMDTAAVMKNLDLVVTTDTATAHLAGALAVPVWVALPFLPDWRWLMDREDSPWYPTMRLFRQTAPGDWQGVFERVANELKKLLSTTAPTRAVTVVISPGELIDKITILEIKSERLTDAAKLDHVRAELQALRTACAQTLPSSERLQTLTAELRAVNETLWQVEDDIRLCERNEDFGPRFIELARSVYRENDLRAALKRRINDLLGSEIVEEKSYASYG
jgi:tetratricopeptide (TPR) repeat protein